MILKDENLFKILKRMWELDNKMETEELSLNEKEFYNGNKDRIKKYYSDMNKHWENK